MVKEINKNKIYAEYFGSLETESLKIDYLRFNLKSYLHDSEIQNLAVYFRRLGFSSYKKSATRTKNVLQSLTISIPRLPLYCILPIMTELT
jgi:hypothetical protein